MQVRFHGSLAHLNKLVEGISVAGRTPRECLEILMRQIPQLRRGPRVAVQIRGCDNLVAMDMPYQAQVVDIMPVFNPAGGNGGLGRILLGSLLVLGSFFTAGGLSSFLFSAGLSLISGGLLQLLAASPDQGDSVKSSLLGPPRNTVGVGQRIPYVFGTVRLFGHIISSDTDVSDVG